MELGFVKRKEPLPRGAAARHLKGKENVCPDGKQVFFGSPLPEGYPRKPLQDITDALLASSGNAKKSDTDCGPSKKGKRVALKVRERTKVDVEAKINVVEETVWKGSSKSGRSSVLEIADKVTLLAQSDLEQPVGTKAEEPATVAASEASPLSSDIAVGSRQRKVHSPPGLEAGGQTGRKRRKSKTAAQAEDKTAAQAEDKTAAQAEAKTAAQAESKAAAKAVKSNIMKFR